MPIHVTKSELKQQYGAPNRLDFDNEEDYLINKEQWIMNNPEFYEYIKSAYSERAIGRAEERGIKLPYGARQQRP